MSPHEFLAEVFPAEMRKKDECVLVSHPDSFVNNRGLTVGYYRQLAWHPRARGLFREPQGWLYCVSTVARAEKLRRRIVDARRAFVLPCDDIGTKAIAPPVEPSYILETSPDNFQYGFLIDPYDVSTPAGAAFYDACLAGLADAGFNDPGVRSASRVIKLPGAVHKSGFITRMVDWSPARSWPLEDLMAEMGVEPSLAVARARRVDRPGRHVDLKDVNDPILDWLEARGYVHGESNHWIVISCPWAHLHGGASGDERTTAGYSPLDYHLLGRAFKCHHSHGHRTQDFFNWVVEQGGPSPDPTFERLRLLQCSQ